MKFLARAALVCFLLIVITSSLLHILITVEGKPILTRKLEQIFRREIIVGSVETAFPFDIVIRGLEVRGVFRAEKIVARGGLTDLFRKSLILDQLTLDGITFRAEKTAEVPAHETAIIDGSGPLLAQVRELGVTPRTGPRFKIPKVTIRRLLVTRGTFNFVDYHIKPEGLAITLKDVRFSVDNLVSPPRRAVITAFELEGRMPWAAEKEEGKVHIEGWVNLHKRDALATIDVKGIDGIYLYPYYSQYVDLEKAGIEKARLNFNSGIHALNNNLTAECHLELTDIVFKARQTPEEEHKSERIAAFLMDIFRSLNQGKIAVDFTIRTRLDRPEFSLSDRVKSAVQETITQSRKIDKSVTNEIIMFPSRLVEGAVKTTTNVSKALVVGTVALGTEFTKAIFGAFKKEKKPAGGEE